MCKFDIKVYPPPPPPRKRGGVVLLTLDFGNCFSQFFLFFAFFDFNQIQIQRIFKEKQNELRQKLTLKKKSGKFFKIIK